MLGSPSVSTYLHVLSALALHPNPLGGSEIVVLTTIFDRHQDLTTTFNHHSNLCACSLYCSDSLQDIDQFPFDLTKIKMCLKKIAYF